MGNGQSIKPDSYEPLSKNPIIASFLRNTGFADELGSGTRNLYHYVPIYSGKPPEMIDGDVFRQIIPLDDEYSFDANMFKGQVNDTIKDTIKDTISDTQKRMLILMRENPEVTAKILSEKIGINERNTKNNIKKLKDMGIIERQGARKYGRWVVKDNNFK